MVILLYFMVYLMLLTPDDKTRQIVFFRLYLWTMCGAWNV